MFTFASNKKSPLIRRIHARRVSRMGSRVWGIAPWIRGEICDARLAQTNIAGVPVNIDLRAFFAATRGCRCK